MPAGYPEGAIQGGPLRADAGTGTADARVPFASAYRVLAGTVIDEAVRDFALKGVAVSTAGRDCLVGDVAATVNEVALPTIFRSYEGRSSTPFDRFASSPDEDAYDRFVDNLNWGAIAPPDGPLAASVERLLRDWKAYMLAVAIRLGAGGGQALCATPRRGTIDWFDRRHADRHGGGASSATLEIDGKRVVYKGRPVENDLAMSGILVELGGEVRVPETSPFPGYGWQRFENVGQTDDPGAIVRHFRRCGWALAVSWLCSATDCHATNAISGDDALYLIDCETWFAGRPSEFGPAVPAGDAADYFVEELGSIGFTPVWGGEPSDPVLLNQPVLCDGGTYRGVADALVWRELATPHIHPVLDRTVRSEGLTLRRIGDAVAQPGAFADEIVAGFIEGLGRSLEERHRRAITEAGSLAVRSRVIVRDTIVYDSLLSYGASPEMADRPGARSEAFDSVLQRTIEDPRAIAMCDYERDELMKGYVPRFWLDNRSGIITGDDGSEHFQSKDFTSGTELIERRLRYARGLSRSSICELVSRMLDRPGQKRTPPQH